MAAAGCYPEEVNNVAELDVVATFDDKSMDWSTVGTYLLPDEVVDLSEILEIEDPIDLPDEYDEFILASVEAELRGLGWTALSQEAIGRGEIPDVLVLVGKVASENMAVGIGYPWWGYWGWYPWYPGWPCQVGCYPTYPGVPVSYTWEMGTLVVDIIDVARSDDESVHSAWLGGLNGVLSGSSNTQSRITQ